LKSLERDGLAKFDGRHWMSSDFAYGRHPKDTGRYVPKKLSQARLARLITRLNERIVTIDMDGTVYDPWACCNGEDYSKIGTAKCRHIREDVMNEARALADSLDASLVVVSWRSRGDMATQRWLKLVGLKVDAVFIPETPDDICWYAPPCEAAYDQIGFKVATIKALRVLGKEVVASFDDYRTVCRAFKRIGIPDVRKTRHLVKILPHEYVAGYLGAPKIPHRNGVGA
jgi:hypothetical protein